MFPQADSSSLGFPMPRVCGVDDRLQLLIQSIHLFCLTVWKSLSAMVVSNFVGPQMDRVQNQQTWLMPLAQSFINKQASFQRCLSCTLAANFGDRFIAWLGACLQKLHFICKSIIFLRYFFQIWKLSQSKIVSSAVIATDQSDLFSIKGQDNVVISI